MIACLDVDYRNDSAVVACVLFEHWTDESPARETATSVSAVADYEPGSFYRRELPCLHAALKGIDIPLTCIVVDGYVWLDSVNHPGLGAHLYNSLNKSVPVIGVAKSRYAKATLATEVFRGISRSPLFVTSVGISIDTAVANVQSMHGPFRIPTLLKRADSLCRNGNRSQTS